jgi:hypothetical protein
MERPGYPVIIFWKASRKAKGRTRVSPSYAGMTVLLGRVETSPQFLFRMFFLTTGWPDHSGHAAHSGFGVPDEKSA